MGGEARKVHERRLLRENASLAEQRGEAPFKAVERLVRVALAQTVQALLHEDLERPVVRFDRFLGMLQDRRASAAAARIPRE